jgi:hypothetical protein
VSEKYSSQPAKSIEESSQTWLEDMFKFEWCPECGRDDRHHTAIALDLGAYGKNWFARCDLPPKLDAAGRVIMNPEGYGD